MRAAMALWWSAGSDELCTMQGPTRLMCRQSLSADNGDGADLLLKRIGSIGTTVTAIPRRRSSFA